MPELTCFLDMDGVITDFVTAMCMAHGRANPYIDAEAPLSYHMEDIWGISAEEFWKPANTADFWLNIPPTPWKDRVLAMVYEDFGVKNVYILTSPSASPAATAGKVAWIQKNIPDLARQFFVGPKKEALAHPDAFLIDDHDENVGRFKRAGGDGSVFPQPWNSAGFGCHDWAHYVQEDIDSFIYAAVTRHQGNAPRTGDPRFHAVLQEVADLHDRKQADYGTSEDSFANYRSGELWGVPAWQNAMMRADEKMNRIRTFARRGDLRNEQATDSFLDLATIAVIGKVLLDENRSREGTIS